MAFAEVLKWASLVPTMRIAILNFPAKLKPLGPSLHPARDLVCMGIHAALTMTATLKHFAGTSILETLQPTIRDVSINILKTQETTLDGARSQAMTLMML